MRLAGTQVLLATALAACSAAGENEISGYLGLAHTLDSDVRLAQPGGTDPAFQDVSWDDESFKSPLY